MHAQYFEGILQLRQPSKEIIAFIEKETAKRKSAISKQINVKNGIDFYMTSQHYLQSLGKKLQKRFGGELKISAKLFSVNKLTSKNVYRVNVLFRPSKWKKGDIIIFKGRKIRIKYVSKKIQGVDIETGKKVLVEFKDIG